MADDDREQYTMGYGVASTSIMAVRTAKQHAPFFTSRLKPGMKVLDCGCGPGTVSLGLAEIVAPGEVVATDIEESQLAIGRKEAERRALSNIRFERASIYELPFESNHFDAVFSSAVIGNLQEPVRGFEEIHRVLKDGGLVAIKEFDHGGDLLYPMDPVIGEGLALYDRLRRHYGHDPESGRKVFGYLQQAGFRDISVAATYDTIYDVVALRRISEMLSRLVQEAFAKPLQDFGWADPELIQRIKEAWLRFPESPGAFYAMAWCEALAKK